MNLSPARILRTLDFGAMMSIAYPMRRDEREAVARFLGQGAEDLHHRRRAPFAKPDSAIMSGSRAQQLGGWSPDASNARFQDTENAGLAAADVPKLKLKWAYAFAGDVTAFGAPAIVNGTLFTGSAGGVVQALDAKSGCIHWLYQANGPVRSGMAVVRENGRDHACVQRSEWLDPCHRCENRKTALAQAPRRARGDAAYRHSGRISTAWFSFPQHPGKRRARSIPPIRAARSGAASPPLRASDGAVVWKTYLVDPPKRTGQDRGRNADLWALRRGVWSRPTVDAARGLLYVTTGDNYSHPATTTSDAVMALDMSKPDRSSGRGK